MNSTLVIGILQDVLEEIRLLRSAVCAEVHVSPCGLWCWPRPLFASWSGASRENVACDVELHGARGDMRACGRVGARARGHARALNVAPPNRPASARAADLE